MLKSAALEIAKTEGLDLVEVSPGSIPVCKIMNYGKFQYDKSKQQKKQHSPGTKEIRIKYNTGESDLQRQVSKVREFLEDGHSVLFVMQVRGRERFVSHGLAKEKFISIVKELNSCIKPSDIQENERGYTTTLHPQ